MYWKFLDISTIFVSFEREGGWFVSSLFSFDARNFAVEVSNTSSSYNNRGRKNERGGMKGGARFSKFFRCRIKHGTKEIDLGRSSRVQKLGDSRVLL